MEETLKDIGAFEKEIKKVTGKRNHLCKNSYLISDYYRYYNKIKPDFKKYNINRAIYGKILNMFYEKVLYDFKETNTLKLMDLGYCYIRLRKVTPKIINDELVYEAAVNWKETMKLWYEDEESRLNKVLVRHTGSNNTFYRIKYKGLAKIGNTKYFKLNVSRRVKKLIKELSEEGKIIYDGEK